MYYVFYRQYFREEYSEVEANDLKEAVKNRHNNPYSPDGECLEHMSYSVYKSKDAYDKNDDPIVEDVLITPSDIDRILNDKMTT